MGGEDHKNPNALKDKKAWWQPGLMIFARSLSWIAGPVLIGVFVGKWLDKKYGTEPWLFLITVGLAFIISMVGLIKESVEQFKQIEKEAKADKKKEKSNK